MLPLNKTKKVSWYVWNVCEESIMNSIEASMPCSGCLATNCQQTTLETRKNKEWRGKGKPILLNFPRSHRETLQEPFGHDATTTQLIQLTSLKLEQQPGHVGTLLDWTVACAWIKSQADRFFPDLQELLSIASHLRAGKSSPYVHGILCITLPTNWRGLGGGGCGERRDEPVHIRTDKKKRTHNRYLSSTEQISVLIVIVDYPFLLHPPPLP